MREWHGWGSKIAILNSSIRKGLHEKVTFDSEGREEACRARGSGILDGENSEYKDPDG